MSNQTLGEFRVRTKFNPSAESIVDQIKSKTAELIDLLQALKNDEASKTYSESEGQKNITIGEFFRLIALAQTEYESAAHWAVKAATFSK